MCTCTCAAMTTEATTEGPTTEAATQSPEIAKPKQTTNVYGKMIILVAT